MQRTLNSFLILLVFIIIPSLLPISMHAQNIQADTIKPANGEDEDSVQQLNAKNFSGTIVRNVIYDSNVNFQSAEQQLSMDIYKPADAERKYPLVLLIHGGGFRSGDKKPLGTTCMALAEQGYVAVSINYRLGWGGEHGRRTCNADTLQFKQAIYRATQDAHAALGYLSMHADEYSIDKNWVFIGGVSAGAVTALFTAYLSQHDADSFFPGFEKDLGELNKNANDTAGAYTLRGVLSMWGAFVDPQLITSSNAVPTIFFQGVQDQVVPFDSAPFARCPGTTKIYGTYPLYNRLKELGITTVAHVDPNGGHGVFSTNFRMKNIFCFLKNVRAGNKEQVYLTGEQSSCN